MEGLQAKKTLNPESLGLENIVINDTMEVYMKPIGSERDYYFGITQKSDIAQKIKQEFLRGAIGNGIVATIQSDKEIDIKVTNLLHSDGVYEIQSGEEFLYNQTVKLHTTEEVPCIKGVLTISDEQYSTPEGHHALIITPEGKKENVDIVSGKIDLGKEGSTIQPINGQLYKVVYTKEVGHANVLPIDAKKFPKYFYTELHTIAHDTIRNIVVADIYWVFDRTLPDGNINANYEAGKHNAQEINLKATTPLNGSEYGRYIVVPRMEAIKSIRNAQAFGEESMGKIIPNAKNEEIDLETPLVDQGKAKEELKEKSKVVDKEHQDAEAGLGGKKLEK